MTTPVRSARLIVRVSVRLRREGGSLSITVPRYITRAWKLDAGDRLIVRSTDKGILLYPRFLAKLLRGPNRPR